MRATARSSVDARCVSYGIRLAAVTAGGTPAATRGIAALDLEPDGDALPARIDLADASGRRASVVVPPAGGRPVVQGPDG